MSIEFAFNTKCTKSTCQSVASFPVCFNKLIFNYSQQIAKKLRPVDFPSGYINVSPIVIPQFYIKKDFKCLYNNFDVYVAVIEAL